MSHTEVKTRPPLVPLETLFGRELRNDGVEKPAIKYGQAAMENYIVLLRISKEEWLQALPRALVAGFVKTDIELQQKGETSGTTVTFVVIDGLTVTVASVGESRCILDALGGVVVLTFDHRLEGNVEDKEHLTCWNGFT
ncbi:hypothetical protein POM88_000744 [Heracleum sosnowskyi]|uniref:PPM-type phosphatase domain-containing protein n=1 Tax=Heracleum sosnowskyi TaxID=360622 RepID=A0AAD8JBP9_9APIA|nr:hypothetical protein POM88_000744 [Heracleum sosnowskyi]